MAFAARADVLAGFAQARTQALARHFHQAKARDLADLHARAIVLQRLAQSIFHLALVPVAVHVDEVDDHQATEITQSQLAGHFVGGFEVGVERRLLDIAALGGARRVDVHRSQRLGVVDHDGAAGGQSDFALVGVLDLRLDLEAVEQRGGVLVLLQLAQLVRHHLLHEVSGFLVHLLAVDEDFADVIAQVVTQGADHQARFLVDQERTRLAQRGVGDGAPDLQQVVEVPLQLFGIAADAGGADDDAHAVRDIQDVHGFLQRGAVVAFNAARDATGARAVRHQHHVAAGQRDVGGQGGALVAALFLVHLHDDFLAFAQEFLDGALVRVGAIAEIVAGDFLQRQEAMLFTAVFDEGGFQGGLDADDPALVDVRFFLFAGRLFDIDVVQRLAINDGDTQLFLLGCVDQDALHCHSSRALPRGTPVFSRLPRERSSLANSPALREPWASPAGALSQNHAGWRPKARARPRAGASD